MEKIRHAEDIQTLGDMMTLMPRAERGRFRCGTRLSGKGGAMQLCLADYTEKLKPLPNDGKVYQFRCRRCGQMKYVNTAELALAMIQGNRRDPT